jgi:hypothetical protein
MLASSRAADAPAPSSTPVSLRRLRPHLQTSTDTDADAADLLERQDQHLPSDSRADPSSRDVRVHDTACRTPSEAGVRIGWSDSSRCRTRGTRRRGHVGDRPRTGRSPLQAEPGYRACVASADLIAHMCIFLQVPAASPALRWVSGPFGARDSEAGRRRPRTAARTTGGAARLGVERRSTESLRR